METPRRWLFALGLTSVACATDPGSETDDGDTHAEHETGEDEEESADGEATDSSTTGTETETETETESSTEAEGETSAETSTDTGGEGGLCGTPACEDALILDLSLQQGKVSEGATASTLEGDDWVSTIDASAGGTMAAPTNPWIYLHFGDAGLEKVEIDDFEALESGAWDIAAKRFGIRLNSGTSGPGCVGGATTDVAYAELDALPDGVEFYDEVFYDDACTLVEDGSGLPGNPSYLMADWWAYPGCVATSGQAYLLELADGQSLKLVVDAYYAEGQEECNESGTMGSGSANMSWRWQLLD